MSFKKKSHFILGKIDQQAEHLLSIMGPVSGLKQAKTSSHKLYLYIIIN